MIDRAKYDAVVTVIDASHANRDKLGGSYPSKLFRFPREVEYLKIKEGVNKVDILPYITANGAVQYTCTIWVHRTARGEMLCNAKMFGERCPLCDSEDERTAKTTKRVVYNVIDRMDNDKIKVLEGSHYLMEKPLVEAAKAEANGNGYVPFAHPTNGATVRFRGTMKTFGGHDYIEPGAYMFEPRQTPITDAQLESAIAFDDILLRRSYDEVLADINKAPAGNDFASKPNVTDLTRMNPAPAARIEPSQINPNIMMGTAQPAPAVTQPVPNRTDIPAQGVAGKQVTDSELASILGI